MLYYHCSALAVHYYICIANILHRSARTVEVHRAHLMHKLGVDNLVDLVKRVASMGLVDLEEKQEADETSPDERV